MNSGVHRMQEQWIIWGLVALALILAAASIGLSAWFRWARVENRGQRAETGAESDGTGERYSDEEYVRQFRDQIDSVRSRGSAEDAEVLQAQYERELESRRALESLKRLAPSELGVTADRFSGEDQETLRQLLDKASGLPPAAFTSGNCFLLGNAYHETGDYGVAVEHYSRCIRAEPDHAQARNNRGFSYFRLGECLQAIRDYNEAIRLDRKMSQAHHNRGLAYLTLGQYKEAIQDCGRAIRLNPNVPNAYVTRGLAYVNLGQHQKAIDDYNRAIRISPDHAEAYNNRGVANVSVGRDQNAIQDYTEAIRIDPEFALAHSNRGLAWANLQRHQEAIADYNAATDLDPGFAQAYRNRGAAHFQLGQHQQALQDYETAASLDLDPSPNASGDPRLPAGS